MNYKTYRMIKALLVALTAASTAWAVVAGNPFVPGVTVFVSVIVASLMRRNVKEVVVDERTYSMASKASLLSYRVFGIAAATLGATLIALSRNGYPEAAQIGFTLAYSVAALAFINYLAYIYYSHKLGGGAE